MDKATKGRLDEFSARLAFLKKYPLKKLPDGKYWTDNLREKIEGAVWNKQFNCFMYAWEQAQKVVPSGFHLPSRDEFVELCKVLGYERLKDKEVAQRLVEECGFVYSGYVHTPNESLYQQGGQGYWWSSTEQSAAFAYSLHFYSTSVGPSYNYDKDYGYAVRLIKD